MNKSGSRMYKNTLAIGTELALMVAGGMFIGQWIDETWLISIGWNPLGLLIGVVAGFAGGIALMFRLLKADETDNGHND